MIRSPESRVRRTPRAQGRRRRPGPRPYWRKFLLLFLLSAGAVGAGVALRSRYSVTWQSPVRLRFQWPLVIAARSPDGEGADAQRDQLGRRLSAYQQYACNKFGADCRVALAIQRAENPRGTCEIYHYNSDGTLDWGYFQINTVHLKRVGVNLRDLLDCKANIDFAYQLYTERGFQPWSTFNSGAYRQFLRNF
jgi:hypothetical protein